MNWGPSPSHVVGVHGWGQGMMTGGRGAHMGTHGVSPWRGVPGSRGRGSMGRQWGTRTYRPLIRGWWGHHLIICRIVSS